MIIYSNEITEYKKTVFELFWNNSNIKSLISDDEMSYEQFRNCVFPYMKHPNTITTEGTYIFFDVDPKRSRYGNTLEYSLYFNIISHDRINITPTGVRVDLLTSEIEKELLDTRRFGIGKLEYGGAPVFSTQSGYYGRTLTYYTTEFRGVF